MTTQKAKRKLTAISSGDVKGYSRLMDETELAQTPNYSSAAESNAQGRRKLDHIIRRTSQAFADHLSQVLEEMVPDLHVLFGKLEKCLLFQLIEAAVGQAAHRSRTSLLIKEDHFRKSRRLMPLDLRRESKSRPRLA